MDGSLPPGGDAGRIPRSESKNNCGSLPFGFAQGTRSPLWGAEACGGFDRMGALVAYMLTFNRCVGSVQGRWGMENRSVRGAAQFRTPGNQEVW